MKIHGDSMSVISGGDVSKSTIGLSAKNSYLAAYYLRDRIYQNKILAVVREYATNAIDEHIKHNIDRPVELSITKDDTGQYFFNVRDYASGLDDSGVRNIFGMYFESTKTKSNDEMGGFGIGSKAGHAYGNLFNVSSYNNGIATHYAFPLESTVDQPIASGAIYNLYSEPTTETGIKITVPINKSEFSDLNRFKNYCKWFVKTCRNTTNIVFIDEGGESVYPHKLYDLTNPNFPNYKFFYSESVSDWYYGQCQSVIRMGDVCYPIPYAWVNLGEYTKIKLNTNIIIDVPVGTFSLPLSREAIENTPPNLEEFKKIITALAELEKNSKANLKVTIQSLIGHRGKLTSSIFGWGFADFEIPFTHASLAGSNNSSQFKNYVLVAIPKNRASREWQQKLHEWAKFDPTTCYLFYTSNNDPNNSEFDEKVKNSISGEYEHVSVKEIRRRIIKKIPKDECSTTIKISNRGHGKLVYFQNDRKHLVTIDEFENQFKDIPKLNEMKTLDEFASYCYHHTEIGYMPTSNEQSAKLSVLIINSERLRRVAESIGLYSWRDQKVINAWQTLKNQAEETRERHHKIQKLINGFGIYMPSNPIRNIKSTTANMAKRATKLQTMIENVSNEISPRGEILKKLTKDRYTYSSSLGLSRSTLRKILTLK